jgi:hypothetical protein
VNDDEDDGEDDDDDEDDGEDDEWHSNDRLNQWNFVIFKPLGLIICKECGIGVPSIHMKGHTDRHQLKLSSTVIDEVLGSCPIKAG